MFYSICFYSPDNVSVEIDVPEETFVSLLESIHDVAQTFAMSDEDGLYYYYFWKKHHDFMYIGCSSELFNDFLDYK